MSIIKNNGVSLEATVGVDEVIYTLKVPIEDMVRVQTSTFDHDLLKKAERLKTPPLIVAAYLLILTELKNMYEQEGRL